VHTTASCWPYLRLLESRHFIIFTDHKPITYAFEHKLGKCSVRQFNHFDFIAQFATDIRHISGQDDPSRAESVTAPQYYDALSASHDSDEELQTLLQPSTGLRLAKLPIPGTTVLIYCDTSDGRTWSYIPVPLRPQVFHPVHDLSHPSTTFNPAVEATPTIAPPATPAPPVARTTCSGPYICFPTHFNS
jgi:cleavage and polyadenylation specificity factor subunit 1